MSDDTTSFQYSRQLPHDAMLAHIAHVLNDNGLIHTGTTRAEKVFFNAEELEEAREALGVRRPAISGDMLESRMQRLTQPVLITTSTFSGGDLEASVASAADNSYPALSREIWVRRRWKPRGCFVTLRNADGTAAKTILDELILSVRSKERG